MLSHTRNRRFKVAGNGAGTLKITAPTGDELVRQQQVTSCKSSSPSGASTLSSEYDDGRRRKRRRFFFVRSLLKPLRVCCGLNEDDVLLCVGSLDRCGALASLLSSTSASSSSYSHIELTSTTTKDIENGKGNLDNSSPSPNENPSSSRNGKVRRRGPRLLRKEEIERWMQERFAGEGSSGEFVLTGYRPVSNVLDCTKSVFYLHNETLNIWTHLVGAIVWIIMVNGTCRLLESRYGADEFTLRLTEGTYYMCILMPVASALYHTYKCINERVGNILLSFDICGIHVLMFARTMMEGYLVFYCQMDIWISFTMFASVCALLLGAYGSFHPHQQWPFIPAVLIAHVPLVSFLLGAADRGYVGRRGGGDVAADAASSSIELELDAYVLLSTSGSVVGVVAFLLFMYRFPECKWPGKFDLVGSSHQWWHVFTWLGPSLILLGMIHLTIYRMSDESKCSSRLQ
eukprot:g2532.t1